MQKKWKTKYLKQRVQESVFFPMLVSLFFALVLIASIYPNKKVLCFVSFLVLFFYNIYALERHARIVRHRKYFYPTNYAVQGIAFAITFLASFIKGNAFLVLFMPYALLEPFGIARTLSVIAVNLVLALVIFVMPYIVKKLKKRTDVFF